MYQPVYDGLRAGHFTLELLYADRTDLSVAMIGSRMWKQVCFFDSSFLKEQNDIGKAAIIALPGYDILGLHFHLSFRLHFALRLPWPVCKASPAIAVLCEPPARVSSHRGRTHGATITCVHLGAEFGSLFQRLLVMLRRKSR